MGFVRKILRSGWTRGFLILGVVVFSFWFLKLRFEIPTPPPPMEVVVSTITTKQLDETMPLLGEFIALENQQIAARIAAPIKTIKADVGDKVAAGDILAVFDDSQIKASYRKAQAELALAQQSLQRAEALRGSPAYSPALTEDRRRQKDAAAAALTAATASLRWTNVTAPYDGTISHRYAQEGQWAGVGNPLFAIVNQENLEIDLKVPPRYFARLIPGEQYQVKLGKNLLGLATLRAEVPELSSATRSKTARLVPDFPLNGVAVNQSVVVELPTLKGTRLMVPKDAVIFEPSKTYGFIVTPITEGKDAGKYRVEMRMLELGQVHKGEFVVESGLAEGDRIIIRGNERVIANQVVNARSK